VVAIGGGTGLSTLLHGLKTHTRVDGAIGDLSAVVTVTDEGGSSGRLRRDFGMLPPGDIRRCLVALSEDEALLSQLFEHRFQQGRGLKGHTLGNLFLTGLTEITGDFRLALQIANEVLATCGTIYPSTLASVRLQATLENGKSVTGETRISRSRSRIARVRLLPAQCRPVPEAMEALAHADIITIGPGSLYTSLIPNLLVSGLTRQIAESRAVKVYVGNIMTQPGETVGLSAAEHIQAIYDHAGCALFDYAVLNDGAILPRLLRRYLADGARPVNHDLKAVRELGIVPVLDNLVAAGEVVRHNSERLASVVLGLR
jgi:uncharacterized cofD-like protein